jgi:hypothetical protein
LRKLRLEEQHLEELRMYRQWILGVLRALEDTRKRNSLACYPIRGMIYDLMLKASLNLNKASSHVRELIIIETNKCRRGNRKY